jgi:hypothetical protein
MKGEMTEEWKNSTVLPLYKAGDKRWRWRMREKLTFLMHVMNDIVNVYKKN